MLLPVLLQKVFSTRRIIVQLLLRRLRMLGRLLMLNITVLVLILMHTVRILIEEVLSKGFKVCGSRITTSASSPSFHTFKLDSISFPAKDTNNLSLTYIMPLVTVRAQRTAARAALAKEKSWNFKRFQIEELDCVLLAQRFVVRQP